MSADRAPRDETALDGAREFVEHLDAAQARLRSIADQALSDLGAGITTTQLRLLERLQRMGESRLIDLADALSIAPSTATRLCDALADRQLIVRHRRGRDRRELQICLTDAGTKVLSAVRVRTVAEYVQLLGRVSAEQLAIAAGVLQTIGETEGRAAALAASGAISA